jgi:hypothetical protein
MKHDPKATANALAVTSGVLYALCAVWTLISKGSYMGLMNTWAHGIDLTALPTKDLDFGTIIIGFITFILAFWITGYIFAYSYNYFVKRK